MANSLSAIQPYLHLMRWYQPAGYWLLLWPCWWSITLASNVSQRGLPDAKLLALFFIGAIAMRSAGCVINDLWDRKIDAQVERTKSRPLASGALSPLQATVLLAVLLLIALMVVLQLNIVVFLLALCSLPFVVLYPLMKRITWWPQAFLGLTFNFGALMGWAAVTGNISIASTLLYVGGIFWTLGYDTIYAHQDRQDDEKIGVKSTARRLGYKTSYYVAIFYSITLMNFLLTGILSNLAWQYFIALLFPAAHLVWQLMRFDADNRELCMRLFKSNQLAGFLLWLPILSLYL